MSMTNIAIAGGLIFAAFKFGNPMIKAGAISVAASILAYQIPQIRDIMRTDLLATVTQ